MLSLAFYLCAQNVFYKKTENRYLLRFVPQTGVFDITNSDCVDAYPLNSGYLDEAYNMVNHMLVVSRCFVPRTISTLQRKKTFLLSGSWFYRQHFAHPRRGAKLNCPTCFQLWPAKYFSPCACHTKINNTGREITGFHRCGFYPVCKKTFVLYNKPYINIEMKPRTEAYYVILSKRRSCISHTE